MKDKGRRDYTLTSAIPGPSSGVHFTAIENCVITAITKQAMKATLHDQPAFSELFVAYLLTRNSRIEET